MAHNHSAVESFAAGETPQAPISTLFRRGGSGLWGGPGAVPTQLLAEELQNVTAGLTRSERAEPATTPERPAAPWWLRSPMSGASAPSPAHASSGGSPGSAARTHTGVEDGLRAPPPRWSKVSSSGGSRAAALDTPSPRTDPHAATSGLAEAEQISPPKQELPRSAGLPRLLQAEVGSTPPSSKRLAGIGSPSPAKLALEAAPPVTPPRVHAHSSSPGLDPSNTEAVEQEDGGATYEGSIQPTQVDDEQTSPHGEEAPTDASRKRSASAASPSPRPSIRSTQIDESQEGDCESDVPMELHQRMLHGNVRRRKTPPGSPARRVRGKTPMADVVAADRGRSPPPLQLGLVPGTGFVDRLALSAGAITPPLKKPRKARWAAEVRDTALMEVPIEALQVNTPDDETPRRYPRRMRIPPLEFWRNERIVYSRPAGSLTACVAGVAYNCAPRPVSLSLEAAPERKIPIQAKPVIVEGQEAEFISAKTGEMESKLVVLPAWIGTKQPATFALPPFSDGVVFVLEGSLRYAFAGTEDVALLHAGDTLKLPGHEQEVLLATAGARGSGIGAKFKVFLVSKSDAFAKKRPAPIGV